MKQGITRFFKYARARHQIYLNRTAGMPRDKWTKDPIFQEFRFTNVFRELDKTTVWFRENVRDRLKDKPEVLLATVVFRLLNRIEVGEAIFCQTMLPMGRFATGQRALTAWDAFLATGDVAVLRHAIVTALPKGPYVTGGYIISSPPGYAKLDGMLEVIRRFVEQSDWRNVKHDTLEGMWIWLKQFDYFGPFHSYEITTDLRFTRLLTKAPDIMTWANPGPGARRGANRVHGRDKKDHSVSREGLIVEMKELLSYSWSAACWPQDGAGKDWPAWEMREVEHTLCEFDKYERVRLGEGRPRGVYR